MNMILNNIMNNKKKPVLANALFLFSQMLFTISCLKIPAFGLVALVKALLIPAILFTLGALILLADKNPFESLDWSGLKPVMSYKIMAVFLFGFLLIYNGLNLLTVINFPLMALLVGLSIGYLWMLYYEFSGRLDRAVYIFFICFPFLNLAEYWLNITKEAFEGGFVFTPTIFFIFSLFLGVFAEIKNNKMILSRVHIIIFLCLQLFLVSGLISSLFSIAPWESFNQYLLQYVYPMLMLPVAYLGINSKEKIGKYINVLIAGCLINVLLFFYIFERQAKGFSSLIDIYSAALLSGITSGTMAILILFILPLILFMIFSEMNKLRTWVYWGIFALFLLLLLFSFSRGSLVAFLASTFVLFFSKRIKQYALTIGIILALIGLISITLNSTNTFNRYSTLINGLSDSSSRAHFNAWSGTLDMIRDYRIFGIGSGMWDRYVAHYVPTQEIGLKIKGKVWLKGYITDPHNIYLRIWIELGIMGLIAWLAFIALNVVNGILILRANFNKNQVKYYLGLSFLIYLIANALRDFTTADLFANELFLYGCIFWAVNGAFIRMLNLNNV